MKHRPFLTVALLWCAATGIARGQAPVPPSAAAVPAPVELLPIRTELLDRVHRGEAPSFALGVTRGATVIWEEALGWADRGAAVPATPATRYPVASVSKSITATAALALAAGGRLQLDQPVAGILDDVELQDAVAGVLVSHLLAHKSGIPHLWHYEYADRPETLRGRRALMGDHLMLVSSPGERYLYTNLGYGVLAEVIERVGDAPFQRVMERTLFEPLGMVATTSDAWVGDSGAVRGYGEDRQAIAGRFRLRPDGGAGFLSTVHDLLRYAQFHLGVREAVSLSRDAAITVALTELPTDRRFDYSRGWGVVRLDGSTVLISDGEAAGGAAAVLLVPERQLGIVVLCNATGVPALEVAAFVLSALDSALAGQLGAAVESIQAELTAPGWSLAGRFDGILLDGSDSVAVSVDFTVPDAPVLSLGGSAYLLQQLGWDRGALEATAIGSLPVGAGKGRVHRLVLMLWKDGEELRGVAQEELFRDGRPLAGIPHRLALRPSQ